MKKYDPLEVLTPIDNKVIELIELIDLEIS